MPDHVDAADYWTECRVCGTGVSRAKVKTVEWANVYFCSFTCRDKWVENQNRTLR